MRIGGDVLLSPMEYGEASVQWSLKSGFVTVERIVEEQNSLTNTIINNTLPAVFLVSSSILASHYVFASSILGVSKPILDQIIKGMVSGIRKMDVEEEIKKELVLLLKKIL